MEKRRLGSDPLEWIMEAMENGRSRSGRLALFWQGGTDRGNMTGEERDEEQGCYQKNVSDTNGDSDFAFTHNPSDWG